MFLRNRISGRFEVEGWIYEGEAVILSNGSKASAISGSDGSGYELAAALGHRLIEPLPALTALKCRNTGFSGWAGVRTEGRITLLVDGKKVTEETGELQLTDYGVSGIPVFQSQPIRNPCTETGKKCDSDFKLSARIFPGTVESFSENTKGKLPL